MTAGGLSDLGYESTARQRRVTLAVALIGVALASVCAGMARVDWSAWQWGIVLFVAFDEVGGVAAMCLPPAIRKVRPAGDPLRPLLFAAFHVQPLLLAYVLPEQEWTVLAAIYLAGAAGALLATITPAEFRASAALAWCAGTLGLVVLAGMPPGLEWLAPAHLLKLVGTHAVRGPEN